MSKIIVGIDEAGRGPLAGDLYAAAVILDPLIDIKGLNDSKKLKENEREKIFDIIIKNAKAYSIAYATYEEIDKLNVLNATFLAMKRALSGITIRFDYVLVDGSIFPFDGINGEAIIKGDSKVKEIMAASILAKVARDRYIRKLDEMYPVYQFAKHKGYPTALHKKMIEIYGPCPIHRKSFKGVKEFL